MFHFIAKVITIRALPSLIVYELIPSESPEGPGGHRIRVAFRKSIAAPAEADCEASEEQEDQGRKCEPESYFHK